MLVVAVAFLVTAEHHDAARAQFGRPLLVGAIVGLGFTPIQAATQSELRRQSDRRQHIDALETVHRQLLLQITLQHDLPGIDLHGQRLPGAYLVGKNLAGANLRGADLRRANLAHADLRRADLTQTRFDGANLYAARLGRAKLEGTSFVGSDLRHARFDVHNWRGGTHWGASIHKEPNEVFRAPKRVWRQGRGEMPPANFSNANLAFARILRSDLSFSSFERAKLDRTVFSNVILEGADFTRTTLKNSFFFHLDLCRASFRWARFAGSSFSDVNLHFADLRAAEIINGGFSNIDVRGALTSGLRRIPHSVSVGGMRMDDLTAQGVRVTAATPELSPRLAPWFGVVPAARADALQCSWGLSGNRVKPFATR